jgi:hypothetical protein
MIINCNLLVKTNKIGLMLTWKGYVKNKNEGSYCENCNLDLR